MPVSDPIADLLTRIRNAQHARRDSCVCPWSRHKEEICNVLRKEGYLQGVKVEGEGKEKAILLTFSKAHRKMTPTTLSEPSRLLSPGTDDCAPVPPIEAYATIRTELEKYSPELAAKPELVVANKIDLPDAVATASEFSRAIDTEVLLISAVTGKGLSAMSEKLWQFLCAAKEPESAVQPAAKLPERDNS